MSNEAEFLKKLTKSKTAIDMINIIDDVNQLAERDNCIVFCERLKKIIVSLSHEDCLLLKKSFVDPADFPINLLVGSTESGTVKVSIIRQLMVTCDDLDELRDLARNCSIFVFEQVVEAFLERISFLKNRRSINELRAICKEYPHADKYKASVVDEWLSQFSDLSDFWGLYIAANKDQQQKVLEKAITLCETTSDVDEIRYYYQEGSDLYQKLIDRRATLPQDGNADI